MRRYPILPTALLAAARRPPRRLALAVLMACLAPAACAQAAEGGPDFSFSGTQRSRLETVDAQVVPRLNNRDHALALQTTLVLEARLRTLRFVGEIMDSRVELNEVGSFVNGTMVDSAEPIQAYVAWTATDLFQSGSESTLRVGRVTLDMGKRRLMSRNRFRNTVSNFIGVDWQWRGAQSSTLRAFYLSPMRALPEDSAELLDNEIEFDRAFRNTTIAGIYYQWPELRDANHVEAYITDYQANPGAANAAANFAIVSLGVRVYRPAAPERWHYEAEAVLQRGESGAVVSSVPRTDLRHHADLVHLEIGYTFAAPWSPSLMLQWDRASGDRNPLDERNERFNTLFGDRRFDFGPTGIFGPFQRSNLETPGLRLNVTPTERWQGMLSYRGFRLASATDTWVTVGLRDPSGRSGDSLGRQLEGSLIWSAIPKRLSLDVGFVALQLGQFAVANRDPNQHGDPTYYYAAVTTTF